LKPAAFRAFCREEKKRGEQHPVVSPPKNIHGFLNLVGPQMRDLGKEGKTSSFTYAAATTRSEKEKKEVEKPHS